MSPVNLVSHKQITSEREPSEETVVSIKVSKCRGILLILKLMTLKSFRDEVLQEGYSGNKYLETGFLSLSALRKKSSVSLSVSYLSC